MSPLQDQPDVEVTWEELKPVQPYPFPWPLLQFFDVFPESVLLAPPAMQPVAFDPDSRFDLVVIAYQVWFLSPSLPVTGFLTSEAARVLRGTPVVTVIVCRNMWLAAQEKMKGLIEANGGRLVDNVALVDRGSPWTTFVTTPRWLLTGRKGAFWGIFPAAGVSRQDIEETKRFGRALVDGLGKAGSGPVSGPLLAGLGAVRVNPAYIMSERMGQRIFPVWGRFLKALGPPGAPLRRVALVVYIVYLVCMILTVVPLGMAVRSALRPLFRRRLDAEVARLEQPSGSATERVQRLAS